MKQVFTEFFVVVKQLKMGKDDNTAKWIYAGYATTCVTGIFALSILTGTPISLLLGHRGVELVAGAAAMSVVSRQKNDRSI